MREPDLSGEPIGPDDWYDVQPDEATGSVSDTAGGLVAEGNAALDALATRQNRLIAGIALILLLGGALAFLVWRRRRKDNAAQDYDEGGVSLASGVSRTLAEQMSASVKDIADGEPDETPAPTAQSEAADKPEPEPVPEPEPTPEPEPEAEAASEPEAPATFASTPPPQPKPIAEPPSEPARIDLALDIVGATRSVMMFTIDFSLEIANRSDRAVRDLKVAAKLSCAQRGGGNAAPIAGGQPIAELERIGPQQSRRVKGTLQLPLGEVHTIRQGSKPLFIPLLHVTLEGSGQPATSSSFVVGSPSVASSARVHPLPLDGPPGSLPELRAQLIKQPQTPASTEPA